MDIGNRIDEKRNSYLFIIPYPGIFSFQAVREFSQIIDSTASFRAYRQALADSTPPCIPYM